MPVDPVTPPNTSLDRLPAGPSVLHDTVVGQLRALIVEGRVAPGQRLNERILCEQLKVSRTPLREAYKVLAAEGLVRLLPNRGAEVLRLTEAEVIELFELIAGLEAMSGELACQRIDAARLAAIGALQREMQACHARRDLAAYFDLNRRIHEAICAAAGNSMLAETYKRVNMRCQSLRYRSNFDQDKWDAAMAEHAAMLESLEQRDGARMRALMTAHLAAKRDAVLKAMRAEQPQGPAQRRAARSSVTLAAALAD
ncbi:GntR family transcriptional regulator [Bordetella sp. N]|uniref:GntR family transcriptional regulator n=1 Tax=Bordetella sp. N TaxID=1746199 RepID=UPI0009E7CA3A|nr:GntR family transcriptional regulator [Bordetella sp. N]